MEQRLQKKFPHVSQKVIRYVLTEVAGSNEQFAQQTLQSMSASNLADLENNLRSAGSPVSLASLSAAQRQKVQEFKAIAGVRKDIIPVQCLSQTGWNLEAALNHFFSMDYKEEPDTVDTKGLEAMFQKYHAIAVKEGASEANQLVEAAGLSAFCKDLNQSESDTDLALLLVAFAMQAQTPYAFSKDEFVNGLGNAGTTQMADIQKKITEWKSRLKAPDFFRDFYRFTFGWVRSSPQAKVLEYESAADLWNLLLKGRWALLDEWISFIKNQYHRSITKDVWYQFIDFIALKPDFAEYDSDGAWPVLFDEFVEHLRSSGKAPPPKDTKHSS